MINCRRREGATPRRHLLPGRPRGALLVPSLRGRGAAAGPRSWHPPGTCSLSRRDSLLPCLTVGAGTARLGCVQINRIDVTGVAEVPVFFSMPAWRGGQGP